VILPAIANSRERNSSPGFDILPNEEIISYGSGTWLPKEASILDPISGNCRFKIKDDKIQDDCAFATCAVSPNGDIVGAGPLMDIIRVWDSATGKCKRAFRPLNIGADHLAITRSGDICCASGSGSILILDFNTGNIKRSLKPLQQIRQITALNNGQIAILGSDRNDTTIVCVLDTISGECKNIIEYALNEHDGSKSTVDMITGLPNGNIAIAKWDVRCWGGSKEFGIVVYDIKTGTLVPAAPSVTAIEFQHQAMKRMEKITAMAAKDEYIFTGSSTGMRIFDVKTGECLERIKNHKSTIFHICVDHRTQMVYSKSHDDEICKLDINKLREYLSVKNHSKSAANITIDTNNREEVSISYSPKSFP
jgi:WD40 repeat protein